MTSLSPTLPARLTVAGLDFEVQLSGARRSIGITVDRDGSLIVNAPNDCDEAELAAFAHEKRMWVYKKLAEKDLLLSHRPTKEFVSGEGFAYLGRSHRLLLDGPARRSGEARTRSAGDAARHRHERAGRPGDDRLVPHAGAAMADAAGRSVGATDGRALRRRSTFGTSGTGGARSARATASTSTGRRSSFRRHSLTT